MTLRITLIAFACTVALAAGARAQDKGGSSDLRQAYKREFAFLKAEKSTLEQRIEALGGEASAKTAAARAEIDRLQGSIMSATLEAERLNGMMFEAERSAEGIEEGTDAIEGTLEQATAMLEKYGVELPEKTAAPAADPAGAGAAQGAPAEAAIPATPTAPTAPTAPTEGSVDLELLDFALSSSIELLGTINSIRREPGEYFDAAGDRTSGEILKIGNVASYGLESGALGALAPAGAERLKVWSEPGSAQSAAALAQGQQPAQLSLFLYESLDKGIERRAEKTALSVVQSGGIIAWVIVGLGAFALLMIVLRTALLMTSSANTGRLVAQLEPLLENHQIDQAIQLCRNSRSAAGRVLRTTLQNLERDREHLEDIVSEAILHETPTLDRCGSTIMVLAAVAPLMGLLGTVTGMISTFDVITEFGTGNPKLLSGGISEALVTTELGLIVAIPSLLLGNMLTGWAERIKDDMDKAALRVTNVATGIRVSRHTQLPPVSTAPAHQPASA